MPMKFITNRLDDNTCQKLGEVVRFAVVGGVATALQYGLYTLLLQAVPQTWTGAKAQLFASVAMTVAYFLSFLFNFYASTRFTFKVKASAKKGAGFAFSHLINYLLQMLLLNFFIFVGVPKEWAPLPMFCVCVPVNFVLVRFFLKR